MDFSNQTTKAGYKPVVEKDRKVYVPGTDKHGTFSGLLSDIPPEVAETMVNHGVNTIARISPAPPAKKASDQ